MTEYAFSIVGSQPLLKFWFTARAESEAQALVEAAEALADFGLFRDDGGEIVLEVSSIIEL